jgi:hypothetical protein
LWPPTAPSPADLSLPVLPVLPPLLLLFVLTLLSPSVFLLLLLLPLSLSLLSLSLRSRFDDDIRTDSTRYHLRLFCVVETRTMTKLGFDKYVLNETRIALNPRETYWHFVNIFFYGRSIQTQTHTHHQPFVFRLFVCCLSVLLCHGIRAEHGCVFGPGR